MNNMLTRSYTYITRIAIFLLSMSSKMFDVNGVVVVISHLSFKIHNSWRTHSAKKEVMRQFTVCALMISVRIMNEPLPWEQDCIHNSTKACFVNFFRNHRERVPFNQRLL